MPWIQKTGPQERPEPEMPEGQRPTILCHYCSVDSFLGIVESRTILLSNSYALNDYRENTWIVPLIQKHMSDLRTADTAGVLEQIGRIYDVNNATPYVTCFSTAGDVLSQWRAYADDGRGVSIGFHAPRLRIPYRLPVTSDDTDLTIGLYPILYDLDAQNKQVRTLLERSLDRYRAGTVDVGNVALEAAIGLRRLAPVFKNPAFREEQEWRIVHTPLILGDRQGEIQLEGNISDIRFRTLRSALVSYFTLTLPVDQGPQVVSQVITGPKCAVDSATIGLCLDAHGFHNVEVRRSDASYK